MSTGSLNDIITQLQADIASLEDIGGEARNRKLKLEKELEELTLPNVSRLMEEIGALPSPIKEERAGDVGIISEHALPSRGMENPRHTVPVKHDETET